MIFLVGGAAKSKKKTGFLNAFVKGGEPVRSEQSSSFLRDDHLRATRVVRTTHSTTSLPRHLVYEALIASDFIITEFSAIRKRYQISLANLINTYLYVLKLAG
jgi:hypothetical protein